MFQIFRQIEKELDAVNHFKNPRSYETLLQRINLIEHFRFLQIAHTVTASWRKLFTKKLFSRNYMQTTYESHAPPYYMPAWVKTGRTIFRTDQKMIGTTIQYMKFPTKAGMNESNLSNTCRKIDFFVLFFSRYSQFFLNNLHISPKISWVQIFFTCSTQLKSQSYIKKHMFGVITKKFEIF